MCSEHGLIDISKIVLWVKLLDITSQSPKGLSIIDVNRGVRSRLCDCAKESEINT